MRLETTHETIQAEKSTPSEKSNDNGKNWKNGDRRLSLEKMKKRQGP